MVDSIQRSGDLRLNANVHLHWYGSDQDGYIDYFNVQVNEEAPGQTRSNDSIFTFVIDAGLDSSDVRIRVSAVDWHRGGHLFIDLPLSECVDVDEALARRFAPQGKRGY